MATTAVQVGKGSGVLKSKSSSDDRVMRLFILVIGGYLVIALALPLYAMFS